MKKYLKASLSIFLVISSLNLPIAQAQLSLTSDSDKAVGELTEQIKGKLKRGAYYVLGIEQNIKNQQEELLLIKNNKKALKKKIDESQTKVQDLNEQLQNLSRLASEYESKKNAVILQIAEKENHIATLDDDIKNLEANLKQNVTTLGTILGAYYTQTNTFFDIGTQEPKLMSILGSKEGTGTVFREHMYLSVLHSTTEQMADEVRATQEILNKTKQEQNHEALQLESLRKSLELQTKTQEAAMTSHERLLTETQGRQAIYEALLELSKQQEVQVGVQIDRMKQNFDYFQQKLDELKSENPESASEIDWDAMSAEMIELGFNNSSPLAWPVTPALGLTALYHEEAYKKAMGVGHNAIDIRAPQNTPIHSAAAGVVTKAVDNGMGYSYIIVAHQDKLMTLYGHVSEILVAEGDVVTAGQTIGLSGGMPGTKGAGWMTTGSHLHLEVFKDFAHVDPLDYLPLELVPVNSLPEKYLKRLSEGEAGKIKREQ